MTKNMKAQVDALENEFNSLTEELDSVAVVDAIIAFCDYAGINAANAMRTICATADWKKRSKEENYIADLIEMSQSAYDRSLHSIRRAVEIAEELDSMEF